MGVDQRTLRPFLSSSRPRSSTKRGISIIDPMINHSSSLGLRAMRKRSSDEKANGQREGSRLSRALAKLDSHSEALRVSEAL